MWFILAYVYEIELPSTTDKVAWILRSVQKRVRGGRRKQTSSHSFPHIFRTFVKYFDLCRHRLTRYAVFPSISVLSRSSSEDAVLNPCDFDLIRVVSVQMAVSLHPALSFFFFFFISTYSLLFGSHRIKTTFRGDAEIDHVDKRSAWLQLCWRRPALTQSPAGLYSGDKGPTAALYPSSMIISLAWLV